ncbi:MAG: hypothetical protein J6D53_09960, partial [Blautia sp.]|nr:hypothetical protein [Blautia sp.]
LEKARESTDLANFRAAKAAIITKYLSEREELEPSGTYDAEKGIFVGNSTEVSSYYGKGTAVPGNTTMADPNGIIDGYYKIEGDDYSDAVIVYVYESDEDRLFLRWVYPPDDEPVNELQFEVDPNKG